MVAIGGGSGLSTLLRGLKPFVVDGALERLTGVVTVADDGGSSGRLRRELGVLPPGDVRACLVALADDEDLLARLFSYRFDNGEGLSGHSFGNLLLAALTAITGDFYRAILTAEEILSVRGQILPATLDDIAVRARGESGRWHEGESAIGASGERLVAVALEPGGPAAFDRAVEAIATAELIVVGPGSLYTSVLPNLLIPGIATAVRASPAPVVMPLNLMEQPGETAGMSAADHLGAVTDHAGPGLVDVVLVNSVAPSPAVLETYRRVGAAPVVIDRERLRRLGVEIVDADLLATGELARHDPAKLAAAVMRLASRALEAA